MRSNKFAWIFAILMAVVAVLSWVYNLDSNNVTPQVQTAVVEQPDNNLTGEIESLQRKVGDLSLAHQGLIEENTALRTLNENLKGELGGMSDEIAQLIQQLDQTNIENDSAKAELESILAKVQNGQMNTVVPETVATVPSLQSSGSQMMEQPESVISDLEEKVRMLTAELEIANARALQLRSDNSDSDTSEQILTDSPEVKKPQSTNVRTEITDLNAEVVYLTAELEIASARTDKLQSENSELSREVQILTTDLGTANAQIVSLESKNKESLLEQTLLEADLSSSRQEIDVLAAKELSLQNEIQSMAVALDQANADVDYLSTRLRYASKHLRRIRKQIRTTESNADALIMLQLERTASLSDELQDKQTQMEQLISDFSAITLKSDVVYESGSARLNEHGLAVLTNVSKQLLKFPNRIVSVEGHADSKQISARLAQYYPTNWELSAARAAAAAKFLIDQGVPEESVRVVGYGPLHPVASNDSDEGRAANRRIEIRLVPELAERNQN